MNWESMDWTTLLVIGGVVLLIFFMMRGCGRMMGRGGGGCGMGGRRHGPEKDQKEGPSAHSPEK